MLKQVHILTPVSYVLYVDFLSFLTGLQSHCSFVCNHQELLCQFRSMIIKLEDDVRISGGTRNLASGENQSKAQEMKDQMTQLTQENVITTELHFYCLLFIYAHSINNVQYFY